MRRTKRKWTKTERLQVFLDLCALVFSLMTLFVILFTERDPTAIEILAGLWIAEASHFHQLYAKKEGRANSQKYAQQWVSEMSKDLTPEQLDAAARMTEVVVQTR